MRRENWRGVLDRFERLSIPIAIPDMSYAYPIPGANFAYCSVQHSKNTARTKLGAAPSRPRLAPVREQTPRPGAPLAATALGRLPDRPLGLRKPGQHPQKAAVNELDPESVDPYAGMRPVHRRGRAWDVGDLAITARLEPSCWVWAARAERSHETQARAHSACTPSRCVCREGSA